MNIFKGQNLIEFAERFKTDEDCKEYLSIFGNSLFIVFFKISQNKH